MQVCAVYGNMNPAALLWLYVRCLIIISHFHRCRQSAMLLSGFQNGSMNEEKERKTERKMKRNEWNERRRRGIYGGQGPWDHMCYWHIETRPFFTSHNWPNAFGSTHTHTHITGSDLFAKFISYSNSIHSFTVVNETMGLLGTHARAQLDSLGLHEWDNRSVIITWWMALSQSRSIHSLVPFSIIGHNAKALLTLGP